MKNSPEIHRVSGLFSIQFGSEIYGVAVVVADVPERGVAVPTAPPPGDVVEVAAALPVPPIPGVCVVTELPWVNGHASRSTEKSVQ